jgi:hypothetical protein
LYHAFVILKLSIGYGVWGWTNCWTSEVYIPVAYGRGRTVQCQHVIRSVSRHAFCAPRHLEDPSRGLFLPPDHISPDPRLSRFPSVADKTSFPFPLEFPRIPPRQILCKFQFFFVKRVCPPNPHLLHPDGPFPCQHVL